MILMIGRITGGVATSLLYSVFESWVVSELSEGYNSDSTTVRHILGRMYLTSYSAAIATGLLSQALVSLVPLKIVPNADGFHWGGSTLPYDASALGLAIGIVIMHCRWRENYGDTSNLSGTPLPRDWLVWLLGLVSACFESAMYIFVFNFTPALPGQPMGFVFALFMIASMSGAAVLGLLGKWMDSIRNHFMLLTSDCLPALFLIGALALMTPLIFRFSDYPTVVSFVVFEGIAGFYWPAMAAVKSTVVAEECRANVYNLYRVPLNGIVVGVLLSNLSLDVCFIIATSLVGLASVLSFIVALGLRRRERSKVIGNSTSQCLTA